uniref:Uncharacterized protein n=1 Tax=Arundo donax TaxID=35708 RepID=A0A0A9A588_ARUDO
MTQTSLWRNLRKSPSRRSLSRRSPSRRRSHQSTSHRQTTRGPSRQQSQLRITSST